MKKYYEILTDLPVGVRDYHPIPWTMIPDQFFSEKVDFIKKARVIKVGGEEGEKSVVYIKEVVGVKSGGCRSSFSDDVLFMPLRK